MRVVVPDQRNVPLTGGGILKKGAVTGWGILPRTTIGSEKTARISFASASVVVSPTGPALITRRVLAANEGRERIRNSSAATLFLMTAQCKARLGTSGVGIRRFCYVECGENQTEDRRCTS